MGHLASKDGHLIVKDGHLTCTCCDFECPPISTSACNSCPSSFSLTMTGWAAWDACFSYLDGTFTLSQTVSGGTNCFWEINFANGVIPGCSTSGETNTNIRLFCGINPSFCPNSFLNTWLINVDVNGSPFFGVLGRAYWLTPVYGAGCPPTGTYSNCPGTTGITWVLS